MSTRQKWGEKSRCFFLPLFRAKKCFLGEESREEKSSTHTQTHFALCCSFETRPRRKGLYSASRRWWWWWSRRRRRRLLCFFARKICGWSHKREREREKKKNGILGNDVRVCRPRRRVRGVHQRHGHSRREPPETRALDNGGDVHVDDVGDNIHGANAPVSATGDEQKRGVEMKSKVENRVFVTRRARETLRREST